MAYLFDDFQKFGKEQLEVVTTSSSSLAKGWQTIAAEIERVFEKVVRERFRFPRKAAWRKVS